MTDDLKQNEEPYDARRDAHDSYFLPVEMKRRRGDRHWPEALCLAAAGPVPAANTGKMEVTSGNLGHDD